MTTTVQVKKSRKQNILRGSIVLEREKSFKYDRLRQNCDIRYKPRSKLTWYQKTQRTMVDKQIREYQNYQLRKSIFRTFESLPDTEPSFPLQTTTTTKPLIDQSINQSINRNKRGEGTGKAAEAEDLLL